DLGVEVVAGVQVKVGMRVPGEAVVAHYAVGDEVAGPGGDVEHRQIQPERLDRYHVQPCVALDRDVVDRALAGDRRIGGVEEPEHLLQPAAQPDVGQVVGPVFAFGGRAEAERGHGCDGPADDRPVGAGDAQAVAVTAFRVENAGEEPLL